MKAVTRKTLAVILTLAIAMSLFPATAYAYVGAMTKNTGGVTAGQQEGYYWLKNDYIGFYIRPDGNLTTVPSQKTLTDVKSIDATEAHAFLKQTKSADNWRTNMGMVVWPNGSTTEVIEANSENPKLRQTFTFSDNIRITITYELVQLDKGETTGTTGGIIEEDDSDDGRTWGVLASASITHPPDTRILWVTGHSNFGGVGHSLRGIVKLSRYTSTYDSDLNVTRTYFSNSISSGLSRMETEGISEAFTDSFSYANQFVAMDSYMNAMGAAWDAVLGDWIWTLISGIRGHWDNYASAVSYSPQSNSLLIVEHEFSGDGEAHALWGFRDLYPTEESGNIPPDPVSIDTDATCVGIINNNGTLSACAAKNEAELKSIYGSKLVAVFRGTFQQKPDKFVFTNGAAQLSPSLTATWDKVSGEFSVAMNGTVTAKGVHLSAPTFKFYKPGSSSDTSLQFGVRDGKLTIGITPANNEAILHIDIPGAKCSVEGVTADLTGTLVLSGEISISTPVIDAANITMKRLGMGWNSGAFSLVGVEASGAVDMEDLLGMDVGGAKAEINSFPGEERYAFELELNVFDLFEAEGELELTRINNGALVPNTLSLFVASEEVGVPLVPPVVVAELNGLGGGFRNLSDTINGDFFAIPPIKLEISAKGTVLEIIEGKYTILVGPGYYKASLTEGTLLEMDIIDEYNWYTELSGDIRTYQGTTYKGLKVGGGMKIDLAITTEMPFIKAGGEFNASAFTGLDSYTSPTKAYLVLGADGKIYGLVQIPDEAWFLPFDLVLLAAELDFALGGQTTIPVSDTTFENAVKEAFGNISGYGGVAYTSTICGWPFRIYYIFQDKEIGIEIGDFLGEMDPFDPSPYSLNKLPLLNADTGEQVGIVVMNDNLTLLASNRDDGMGIMSYSVGTVTEEVYRSNESRMSIMPLSVGTNDAQEYDVDITQTDGSERSYRVVIGDDAPDTGYLVFALAPGEGWDGTVEEFMNSLTVQKDGEGSPLQLVPAVFDNGTITNEGEANVIAGDDCLMLKLPSKGTWTISSDATAFDISCLYASPYASLSGMELDSGELTGTAENMNSAKDYVLRIYLGNEKGGTDYLLAQIDVPSNGDINETLSLSGTLAPTGSYYVTTVLLEEVNDDFDGDGSSESAYVTTDTFEFDERVDYTNIEQPNPPTDVTLEAIGSELMRVKWKCPAEEPGVDGYYIRLYQEDGSDWTETGANYLLKASDLTEDAEGYYTYDMAVTVGDKALHLKAGKTYKVGITAFRYLEDEDDDGTNDSLPVESSEAESDGEFLPEATYPVLNYSPEPSSTGDSMKLLCINGETEFTITSDVPAKIVVTRMDTDEVVADSLGYYMTAFSFNFNMYALGDFAGALNLKITATDAEGDITVDYLGLRFDDTAPLITLDSDSFMANRNTGAFTVSGVTESGAMVEVTDVITGIGTSGVRLNADEVTADENGVFTITGRMSDVGSATLILCACDAAGNASINAFAQILQDTKITDGGGRSRGSSASIKAGAGGKVSAESLKDAAQAAGQGGTVTVETSGGLTSVTGEGLQFLIDNNCALRLTTSSGTMLIPAEALAGLGVNPDSQVQFVLSRPETFSDPDLQAMADAGNPVYEISILIDGEAVHNLAGAITVTLEDSAFTQSDGLRVIHVLDSGAYREVAYTLAGGILSFALDSLSYVCVLDGETAAALLRNPFTDVTSNDWFYDNVLYVYRAGLMTGTSSNTFSPYTGMTRAMVVTVLHRLSGDTGVYTNTFTDVAPGAWYENAVAWAAANKIAGGTGNGCFSPDKGVTREQLAVLMHNYAKHKGYDVSVGEDTNILSFNDALNISDYAYAALQWACGEGIINGDGRGNLNPQGFATRAEVAAMLQRFIVNTIN